MEEPVMANRKPTTPDEILEAALAREEEALAFYADLAGHCRTDVVRELLERLKDEESRHTHLIRDLITKLNLGKDVV
jgi:rubrerythrin